MKKIYLLLAGFVFSAGSMAQGIDTLVSHFVGTPTLIGSQGGGYVSGNNDYGDKSKMQLFDQNYGVVGPGTISKVLLWIPVKEYITGGSFAINIWSDVAGEPGTIIGTTTMTVAAIDTVAANIMWIGGAVPYNVTGTFGTAISYTGQKFWAGVVLPTTAGDTIGIATTSDGDFADGITHTGEYWSDNTFHTFGDPANWNLNVALAIFPIVNITALSGIEENVVVSQIYPNPTNGMMNFVFATNQTSHIVVRDLAGRSVATVQVNAATTISADFSELAAGTYLYETVNFDGVVTSKSKFVKQ